MEVEGLNFQVRNLARSFVENIEVFDYSQNSQCMLVLNLEVVEGDVQVPKGMGKMVEDLEVGTNFEVQVLEVVEDHCYSLDQDKLDSCHIDQKKEEEAGGNFGFEIEWVLVGMVEDPGCNFRNFDNLQKHWKSFDCIVVDLVVLDSYHKSLKFDNFEKQMKEVVEVASYSHHTGDEVHWLVLVLKKDHCCLLVDDSSQVHFVDKEVVLELKLVEGGLEVVNVESLDWTFLQVTVSDLVMLLHERRHFEKEVMWVKVKDFVVGKKEEEDIEIECLEVKVEDLDCETYEKMVDEVVA